MPPGSQPDPSAAQPARAPVRVYNNARAAGVATRAAADFEGVGWTVTEVGNYSDAVLPTSTVYFRPGTGEEAAARDLAAAFGLRVEPRFAAIAAANPGLIVIVTNDYSCPDQQGDVSDPGGADGGN